MFLEKIEKNLKYSPLIKEFFKRIELGEKICIKNCAGSFINFLAAFISGYYKDKQILLVFGDTREGENNAGDMEFLLGKEINYFPPYQDNPFQETEIIKETRSLRLKTLENLLLKQKGVYIATGKSLCFPILPPSSIKNYILNLERGKSYEFYPLIEQLVNGGFRREKMVTSPGDLSVRGGIVDIYPLTVNEPLRLEFFGDIIESIRIFDINTQRSLKEIDSVSFTTPVTEITIDSGGKFFDYLNDDAIIIMNEPENIKNKLDDYLNLVVSSFNTEENQTIYSTEEVFNDLDSRILIEKSLLSGDERYTLDFKIKGSPAFNRNLDFLISTLKDLHKNNPDYNTYILCDNQGQADRLDEILLEQEDYFGEYTIIVGSIQEGFVFPDGNLIIFTDHEIFKRKRWKRVKFKGRRVKDIITSKALIPGDFIVHEDYGIGKFMGLEKEILGGSLQECLKILYKNNDIFYLNVDKLFDLQKYSGQEGIAPQLSKLGSNDWNRIKNRTKKSLQNIAKELLTLYASRKTKNGFAFSPDTHWQNELEASFIYEETPDQLKSTWEIKKDMENKNVMDRLVCGDVGYGKTEVALRAAFKCVNDSKQVAVLVPTTILAQQHYETFRERLIQYPINVEVLSRFKTTGEQKNIISQLKEGKIDIIIGTHRLISKDVAFKDLGLLIIDEEQRFGVVQKEKLKKIRTTIDVLTMTATPIPRTLHMSLMGARDLSNINTPPKNRLPIITELTIFNENLIRNAIIREIDRGGQVYFVHNRVKTINSMASKLKRLLPGIRFAVAHGQMKVRELEKIMLNFLAGEFDCLISTMIIESGLDIPNVNTIIIDRADCYGLSQLYQLRGRVGRSNIQAYAYLLIQSFQILTDIALKRLRALLEYEELGAGFQIAMKDLEIRGAGNLLGAEQSGHINAIGFELYTKILEETVKEEKAKLEGTIEDVIEEKEFNERMKKIKIETDIDVYLPEDYVEDNEQRVEIYRRISAVRMLDEIEELKNELKDRYGSLPLPAQALLDIIFIKLLAFKLDIDRVVIETEWFYAWFTAHESLKINDKEQFAHKVSSFLTNTLYPFTFVQGKKFGIKMNLESSSDESRLEKIKKFLNSISRNL